MVEYISMRENKQKKNRQEREIVKIFKSEDNIRTCT
jgi:hypothetical protein